MNPLREQATKLALAGIPVFPCRVNEKAPATARGFRDATLDIDTITAWWSENPNYNIATGLAYTLNLTHITDLTPEEPLVKSATPGTCHTWRYSHWLRANGKLFIYAECARPNNTNEIRLFRI